ncbi:hypothetical protein SAMN04489761_2462 [Tenacibaculum sp. MAR_2009_124]|uniref:DUF4374 domain-containing protein n=1 Tax=Tenacibaculum sp. MAR_2009_124 TaxID=1250059 RepID=UPI00089AE66B|nr:hypothetical protein [Tenacibaculum sp. MAR_2009_124]SEC24103.1 hypothetical protein SAMN04489761_2462 [Tenacibaculum sp. MAR_2009_124]
MNTRFKFTQLLGLIFPAVFMMSCSSDNDNAGDNPPVEPANYSVLANIDRTYYLAQTDDLTQGNLSFVNNGTQLNSDISAKVLKQGDFLYSLNYGTGILTQLRTQEDGSYATVKELDAGLAVGSTTPRYKIANETTLMLYNVTTEEVKNNADEIVDYVCTLRFAAVNLPDLTISNLTEFVIPQSENAKLGGSSIGFHPMRVDSPVISGNKIYFGIMHLDIQSSPIPPFRTPKQTGLETLVFDYPSFANGKIVESNSAAGHTGGYRAPSMHVDERGDVYQSNWFASGSRFDLSAGDKTVIKKLTNGSYDETYEFNISEALGLDSNVGTIGWFYVGNGVGFMPIHIETEGNIVREDSWKVAKINVYNKTAELLDVPFSRLFSYQNGVIEGTKFFMAISPQNQDAFIYEFNTENSSVKKGLALDGGNLLIEGIY